MFFVKFFYFLKGYVIIRVESLCVERFISICIRRSIKLLEIDKRDENGFLCIVSNDDFKRMIPVVYKTKSRVRIVKKYGPEMVLNQVKRHIGFFIGLALFPAFLIVMSQFVWSVHINGVSEKELPEITERLENWGIGPGMLVSRLPAASDIKVKLMDEFNDISWAWVYSEGTRVRVEIKKGIPIPKVDDISVPCDVVSLKSGIISGVTIKRGEACVRPGSAVSEGDILISGTVENKNGGFHTVHAEGAVYADTSHTESGEFLLHKDYNIPTGNIEKYYTLNLFLWKIPLFWEKNPPFESYTYSAGEWEAMLGEEFYLGFGVKREIFEETVAKREQIPYDTAVEAARCVLEEKISKSILPGSVLNDSHIQVEKISEDKISVLLTMNFTEKIGAQRLFE